MKNPFKTDVARDMFDVLTEDKNLDFQHIFDVVKLCLQAEELYIENDIANGCGRDLDLLDAEEKEQARLDLLAEQMQQPAAELIDQLLHDPSQRDVELWQAAGVPDINVTIDDYEAMPVDERGPDWFDGISAMRSALKLQAVAEGYQPTKRR
jgi:hypothetical protein